MWVGDSSLIDPRCSCIVIVCSSVMVYYSLHNCMVSTVCMVVVVGLAIVVMLEVLAV